MTHSATFKYIPGKISREEKFSGMFNPILTVCQTKRLRFPMSLDRAK